MLVNGTLSPQVTLPKQYVRLRILNAEIEREEERDEEQHAHGLQEALAAVEPALRGEEIRLARAEPVDRELVRQCVPLHAGQDVGQHDHQGELAEVRGLQAEETEVDPAPGAVDGDADVRDAGERHREAGAAEDVPAPLARLLQVEPVEGEAGHDGDRHVGELTVERGRAVARGERDAGAILHHQAEHRELARHVGAHEATQRRVDIRRTQAATISPSKSGRVRVGCGWPILVG